jgi:hypothetical protein
MAAGAVMELELGQRRALQQKMERQGPKQEESRNLL